MVTSSNNQILKIMLNVTKIYKNLKIIQIMVVNMVFLYLLIETTYKNSFFGPVATLCPAKVVLETKAKGFFNGSR